MSRANSSPADPVALAPILLFVWLNSLGTGAVTNGVFFLTKHRFDFTPLANFALGLFTGVVYIGGALGVGLALREAARRVPAITPRRVLAAQMVLLGFACLLPPLAPEPWTMWLFAAIYLPLTGALWPIVESFLSGGRRGASLRRATSGFNLCWASAVAAAYWGMSPLLEQNALAVLTALALVHFGCIPLLRFLPERPPRHLDEPETLHPPVYEALLPVFRWLLVLSYVLLAALNPLMPWKLELLEVPVERTTLLVSVWTIGRLGMFVLLGRWDGWHGRWRTPLWTGGAMFAGFALAMTAPSLPLLLLGLTLFGIGIGGVYSGALYYAMEVGTAEVDAGGKHEATIGAGYAMGPLTGLLAVALARSKIIEESAIDMAQLAFVALVCGAIAAIAVAFHLRARRRAGASRA